MIGLGVSSRAAGRNPFHAAKAMAILDGATGADVGSRLSRGCAAGKNALLPDPFFLAPVWKVRPSILCRVHYN